MAPPRSGFAAPPQGGGPGGPAEPDPRRPLDLPQAHGGALQLDERALSKLRWRCRRGLLENDLFVERFFRRQHDVLSVRHAEGLMALMDLADNDLLDLLLARTELEQPLDTPIVREVLAMMRSAPAAGAPWQQPSPN